MQQSQPAVPSPRLAGIYLWTYERRAALRQEGLQTPGRDSAICRENEHRPPISGRSNANPPRASACLESFTIPR